MANYGIRGSCYHSIQAAATGRWVYMTMLYLVVCMCVYPRLARAIEPVPQAADILTMVNRDAQKDVRLDANLYIPDGGELLLNIDVPREPILLDSQAPAKITRVYSDHIDGVFGVGEDINIFIEFTSSVDVVGTPTLPLWTGCHTSQCHLREIQRLRCQGTSGKFAVSFDGQRVVNIPWDASAKTFALYLQRMTKLDKVLVEYHQSDGAACTFFGNNITVTFESVNIDGIDGDLPEMTADPANSYGDGSTLGHVRLDAILSPKAWEIQKGKLVRDREARYIGQTNPQTLQFLYTVQDGDNTTALEYANSDALTQGVAVTSGHILNAGTQIASDTTLPPPRYAGDWERGMGSSLSANNKIQVDVGKPRVMSVTSSHEDGTFGIGEVLLIQVVFSLPVVATGLPTLVLETGQVDRIIPFTRVTGATNNIVEFQYTVQAKDTTADLTYASTTALQLNGGSIKRQSTAASTNAILTLPVNGERGSLSNIKNIVIDTSNPKIASVTSVTTDGVYTGGDSIQIQVSFDTPVVVTGSPQLFLNTGSVDLFPGSFVQVAPALSSAKTILFPAVDHGLSTAASAGLQFMIDGQVYTVASVSGDAVTMVEDYISTVVDPTALIPVINLAIKSPGYRPAKYTSGSGTRNLIFTYNVQLGDTSSKLAYVSTSALQLNSGTIKRLSTTPFSDADLTLSTPGTKGSLSFTANLVVNTDRPRVLQVNAITRNGVYRAGDELSIAVVFDLPVVVQPTASIKTTASTAEEHFAVYNRGSGTTTIVFTLTCHPTDQVAVFDVFDTMALRPSYGSTTALIRRKSSSPFVPALLDLPVAGLTTKGISIDQSCAFVVSVSTLHEDATAGTGEVLDMLVVYNVPVTVDTALGTPVLQLTTGKPASYVSGSGTTTLTFRYTVQVNDPTVRLNYGDIFSMQLNGATIKETSTAKLAATVLLTPITNTLATQQIIVIDTRAPTVVDVTTRALDGVYTVGDRITVSVAMNVPIAVAATSLNRGTPALYLQLGGASSVSTPASFVSVNDERLYFAVTIAAGHSTSNLAYPSRVALRCVGNYGLNKDGALSNAFTPHAVEFQDRLFAVWSEKSTVVGSVAQLRAKSLDIAKPFASLWRQEDGDGTAGRIQFDATMEATNPMLAMLDGNRLYVCWQERSATVTGNPTQIRVASYIGGDTSVLQRWRFVDRSPAVAIGINRDSTQNGASPHMVAHAGKLYGAWQGTSATTGVTQIRVAVFNGQDLTPAWAFVDGNVAGRGINYANARVARNVRLISCRSTLYATWEEANSAGITQIRVSSMTGTDAAPKWVFVDGSAASVGLNFDSTMHAKLPSAACVADTLLVIAWHELVDIGMGVLRTRIRAKQLSLPITAASPWRTADASKALNLDASQNAVNVRLRTHPLSGSTLYATWEEVNTVTGKSQVRTSMFTGGELGSWARTDGGSSRSAVNDVATQDATAPVLVGSSRSINRWYAVWQETHETTQMTHVRTSLYRISNTLWQSLHDRCVLFKSTASLTPSDLLLPDLNTMGALDFNRKVRIDTARPIVVDVSFASSSKFMAWTSAVQTVDIFNVGSLTQGQYQLSYNGDKTVCIDWNAPFAAMKAALEGVSTMMINVQVTVDTTSFQDATRYTITFTFPTTGLKPLQVEPSSSNCAAWVCGSSAPRLPCNFQSIVQVNNNRDVTMRSGIVDAFVKFSSPVVVTIPGQVTAPPPPTLTLETGVVDSTATYTARGILRQFDVGANSPSLILNGEFRLQYGDLATPNAMETTDCIDASFESNADAEDVLQTKLLAIKSLRTIGIQSVSRAKTRNGYRYSVLFTNSSSGDLLDLVTADASACKAYAGRTQTIDVQADSTIVQGEFQVSFEDQTTACIPATIRARGPSPSMEAILSAVIPDRVIPLQVVKDTAIFGARGHRFYVSFLSRDDAKFPITIPALASGACTAFLCDDGIGGTMACTGVTVVANADFAVAEAVSDIVAFQYHVLGTDTTSALAVRDSHALVGDIYRQSLNPVLQASLTVPTASSPFSVVTVSDIRVVSAQEIPQVVQVFSTTLDDTYSVGDVIVIYVTFTQAVDVIGRPILELNSNGVAVFLSGSGTTTLEFRYRIQVGEASLDLDYLSTLSLRTPGQFVSICAAGSSIMGFGDEQRHIDADLTLPSLANGLASTHQLVVATAAPTVVSVSSTRIDTLVGGTAYGVGDIIDLVVTFSNEVTVMGKPQIPLNSGGKAVFTFAGYRQLLDIGVNALYPVTSGHFAVSYRGIMSSCIDYTDPDSVATTSLKSQLLMFPEVAMIGIVSVMRTPKKNGYRFEIIFDTTRVLDVPEEVVPVVSDVCAPLLPSSPSTSPENLLEQATDTQVVFHYHVPENDASADLDYTSAAIDLSAVGAAVQFRSRTPSVNADVTLPIAGSANSLGVLKDLVVDGSPVVVVDIVSDTAAGTYGVAFPSLASPATVFPGEILFRVIFSRPVKVIGSPSIELATGSLQANGHFLPNRFATFVNQPNPNEAAFLYHIQEGDESANLEFANVNVLADATVYCVSTSSQTLARTAPLPRLLVSATSVLKIDASSVPTTVQISSPHENGIFGAGEAFAIQVAFSKPVTLQTGLNRNHDWYARNPVSVEFGDKLFVLWTEWDRFEYRPLVTKSFLYLRVFASDTLDQIPLSAPLAAEINRLPNTFIERVFVAIWQNELYATWDESGQLYCAHFKGLAVASEPWKLIPNMGLNKDLHMRASDEQLLVHNGELILVWREEAAVMNANAGVIGQIHVAQRNDDIDAPLWIFHDGNDDHIGINKNALSDAKQPHAAVYRGMMYVVWSEYDSELDAYQIVMAKRLVQNRDQSVWQFVDHINSRSAPQYQYYISNHRPRLAVRKKGFEDAALVVTWYRDTPVATGSEAVYGEMADTTWNESTASIPLQVLARGSPVTAVPNAKFLETIACGDVFYASWIEETSTTGSSGSGSSVQSLRVASLAPDAAMRNDWTTVFATSRTVANHNTSYDVSEAALVCSRTSTMTGKVGVFWIEFDGITTKLRLRHSNIPQRLDQEKNVTWGETSQGAPLLQLDTATTPPGYAFVMDRSGLQSRVLTFLYVVRPGDVSLDLDVLNQQAFLLNDAQVRDFFGQVPDFSLFPLLQDPRSLSFNNQIAIDTTAPVVVDVTSTKPSGEYGVGETIQIMITFSLPVVVSSDTSPPVLYMRSDELHLNDYTANAATYVSGSGSTVLVFAFTTSELDYCDKLDYFRIDSLALPTQATTIRRLSTFPTTNAILALPVPNSIHSLSGNRLISIKPTQPRVTSVTTTVADGTYFPGDAIPILVTFTLPVVVYGTPVVRLNTGNPLFPTEAEYTSGNDTHVLTFQYNVVEGDVSTQLDVMDDRDGSVLNYVHSLALVGQSSIKRLSMAPVTNAVIALPAPGLPGSLSSGKTLVIDSIRPTIVDVRATNSDGTYDIGHEIEILVTFSRRVVVTQAAPLLKLNVEPYTLHQPRVALYQDGSSTTVLRFIYIVQLGDNTGTIPLDTVDDKSFLQRPMLMGAEMALPAAQVLCDSGNPILAANLTMPRPGPILRVNAVRSLVGNSQKIFLRTDGFRVVAVEATGVESGDVYAPGQRLVLSVVFTDVVIVQGTPRLKLNGNTLLPTYALYISGSGTRSLQFEYNVAMGDSVQVLETSSRSALELPPGSMVTDAQGVYVPLRLGAKGLPGSLSFQYQVGISSIPPTVTRVYVQNANALDGGSSTFGVGDDVVIAVHFSRKVSFPSDATTPLSLLLQFANGARSASYVAGDKTDTLLFSIRIALGDTTDALEYVNVNALVVPATGLFASATTLTLAVTPLLPLPGSLGSLSKSTATTQSTRISSTAPYVVAVDSTDRAGTYGLGDRLRIRVRFSYRLTVAANAVCGLEFFLGGSKTALASLIGGSTTDTLVFEYRVAAGDRTGRLDYRSKTSLSCTSNVLQLSANPGLAADLTLPAPGGDGSLAFIASIRVDAAAPRVTSVSSSLSNGIYGAGQEVMIQVTFSEPVEIQDDLARCTPRLRLAIANAQQTQPVAVYSSGSGSATTTFKYTTAIGDMAFPLAYDGVDALFMDTAPGCGFVSMTPEHRRASVRLPLPASTGSLSNNRDIRVDGVEPPRVLSVSSMLADGIYTAGDTVTVTVTFTTPVIVTGTPYLQLDVGQAGQPARALYQSGSGSPTLLFTYVIQPGDHSDRLEYVRCPGTARLRPQRREFDKVVICLSDWNALQLGVGGSIQRLATIPLVDAVLDLPEVSRWPKLRVATPRQDFVYVDQLDDRTNLPNEAKSEADAQDHMATLANEVSISQQKSSIYIYSNGIPNHQIDAAAPRKPIEQRYFIELMRFPVLQPNPLSVQGFDGFIGVMRDGIPFKTPMVEGAQPPLVVDACGGTLDELDRYYYADVPTCLIDTLIRSKDVAAIAGSSPFLLIGYAFDGVPVYHFFDEMGRRPLHQLDECNGYRAGNGGYRYHLRSDGATPFMPCLKAINDPPGTPRGQTVNQLRVFRSPVDIRQVDGLTLATLSRFDGLVVDENPATATATATWLNPRGVSVVYSATAVIVRSNGIPNGQYGPFPNAYNQYVVRQQDYVFQLPRQPLIAAKTTALPLDTPIGVMLNGVPFFASQSLAYNCNIMDRKKSVYWMMDKCHGLVDAGGDYRYYGSPDCLLTELGGSLTPGKPSPLLGYALDGFPLYGPFTESGTVPTDLDECNGRIGDDGSYRYHVSLAKAPYLIGCFKGTPSFLAPDQVHRSLSYAKAIRIDTQTPRVTQIFTNKHPGKYVLGETLDLVTKWSAAVKVDTTNGIPYVEIPGTLPRQQAMYDALKSTASQSVFVYTVVSWSDVPVMEFTYDFRLSIHLNGGSIKRTAVVPVIDADVQLVWAERTSRFASKHQLVQDVRVLLRGLYHPHASDLRVRLHHGDQKSATIVDGCCGSMAFGLPDEKIRINKEQLQIYPNNPTSGVGYDYGFQDFMNPNTKNLARNGGAVAMQSSTSGTCFASNAIDGRTKGMVTSQDVARTGASLPGAVAWWGLRLLKPVSVGTIRVWLPQRPDRRPAVVQRIQIDSADGVAQVYGSFTLHVTTWDGRVFPTTAINWNAVAMVRDEDPKISNLGIGKDESIEAKILAALPSMTTPRQRLFVTRTPAVAALSANGAFTWSVTFLDDAYLYDEHAVPLSVGINGICDRLGLLTLTRPLSGDDHDEWTYISRDDNRRPESLVTGHVSMFPFWIMLFQDTAVMNFETFHDALNASIWSFRVDERQNGTQLVSVDPPAKLANTQFIRIVAEKPSAFLTLAEVEVFQERNHILSQYTGGTPISTEFYPGAETWSPEESFQEKFGQMSSEGTWTLALQDVVKSQQPYLERDPIHGAGAISDWVLQVTNAAGKTRTYYMDIKAHIKRLPRFGKLYVAIAQTDTENLDRDRNGVLDLVEADRYLSSYFLSYGVLHIATRQRVLWNFLDGYTAHGGIEILSDPSERQKIYPSPVCDRTCLEDLGLDPYYAGGTTGDRALKPMEISKDRSIRYIPNPGYTGLDTVTFSISIGTHESMVLGTVELHVRECQDVNCALDAAFLHRRRINP